MFKLKTLFKGLKMRRVKSQEGRKENSVPRRGVIDFTHPKTKRKKTSYQKRDLHNPRLPCLRHWRHNANPWTQIILLFLRRRHRLCLYLSRDPFCCSTGAGRVEEICRETPSATMHQITLAIRYGHYTHTITQVHLERSMY